MIENDHAYCDKIYTDKFKPSIFETLKLHQVVVVR